MRPANLRTKIFLDSGDPSETEEAMRTLGFLDGQTTNPSLFAKSASIQKLVSEGKHFTKEDLYKEYKNIISSIRVAAPEADISIEVYADENTTSEEMLRQAEMMMKWTDNFHIKLPTTHAGLAAAQVLTKENVQVNMTLCFTQEQAAAVYIATAGARNTYVSPFIGRLDDKGLQGSDLVQNIVRMYQDSDQHVKVLTASIRDLDHFLYVIALGTDIVTVPLKVLKAWKEKGMYIPPDTSTVQIPYLETIPYKEILLSNSIDSLDIAYPLTDSGIAKFSQDWNNLLL